MPFALATESTSHAFLDVTLQSPMQSNNLVKLFALLPNALPLEVMLVLWPSLLSSFLQESSLLCSKL
jgi:hypothetical protein